MLSGVSAGNTFRVDAWVMSCRAFARRIEYAILDFLFREFDLQAIELAYEPTPRNGPFRDFLQRIGSRIEAGLVKIDRDTYKEKCLPLFHEMRRHP